MVSIATRPNSPKRPLRFLIPVAAVALAGIGAVVFVLKDGLPWDDDGSTGTGADASSLLGSRAPIATIEDLERRRDASPDDLATLLELSGAYLQAVRETGDPSYYARAGEVLADASALAPDDPDVFATQGMLALGRHDFRAALDFGQRAVAADPERARYYGVLADAQVELGMYDEAVVSLQEMVNRRPDFDAFSRIAYLRELHGDPEGAIEAMTFALEAGSAVPENQAWAHTELGRLLTAFGRYDEANAQYEAALAIFPGYAVAQAGLGHVAAAQGDLDRAASLYQQALDTVPLPAYAIALGDIATSRGDEETASRNYGLVAAIDQLYTSNGTNTDVELALFLADHGSATEAVARARAGYEAAPSIHAADALAWSLFRAGEVEEARTYAAEALRLGTRDPLKLFHAGMIAKAGGETEAAREYLTQALAGDPGFSILHAPAAHAALEELSSGQEPRPSVGA